MNKLIITQETQQANGQTTRQPIQANGTAGELRDAQAGDEVELAWNPDRPAIVGMDGRLWFLVKE